MSEIGIDNAISVLKILLLNNQCSYFQSLGWLETWLKSIPGDRNLELITFYNEEGNPVSAFFLGKNKIVRHKFFKSSSLFFNILGMPFYDALCIQYNSFLGVMPDKRQFRDFFKMISVAAWDEFILPALDAETFTIEYLEQIAKPNNLIIDKVVPSYYIDLKKVAPEPDGYLGLLSSGLRSQIRRSFRGYESMGCISIEIAAELEKAMEIFDEMVFLHQESWQLRGCPGSFANKYLFNFHSNLIKNRFFTGEIQLIRVSAGNETIGCLYNFVFNKKVICYQSGFRYESDPRLKPGMIAHSEAIKLNAAMGNCEYDFLSGDDLYKKRFSTDRREMVWVRIQKKRVKFCIENILGKVKKTVNDKGLIK